jgi:hypothetical protein
MSAPQFSLPTQFSLPAQTGFNLPLYNAIFNPQSFSEYCSSNWTCSDI